MAAGHDASPADWEALSSLASEGSLLVDDAVVHSSGTSLVYWCSIEGQMFEVPLERLVDAYWNDYATRGRDGAVAFELVDDLAREHRPGLVDAVRALADGAIGDSLKIAYLGAVPARGRIPNSVVEQYRQAGGR